MSARKGVRINGHNSKRRKLSHDSSQGSQPDVPMTVDSDGNDHDMSSDTDEATDDETSSLGQGSVNETHKSDQQDAAAPRRSVAFIPTSSTGAPILLQAQNLVSESTPNYSAHIKQCRPLVDKVVKLIKSVPGTPQMSIAEAQNYAQKELKVTVCWNPRPKTDSKYRFAFIPPSAVTIGGTLFQNAGTQKSLNVVISPQMPSELFQEKDYLNHRALHKRAFYLACLASALKKALSNDHSIRYGHLDDNDLLSVIEIKTTNKAISTNIPIIISPVFPDTVGPSGKMTPDSICIRKNDSIVGQPADSLTSTPSYNSTVRLLSSSIQLADLVDGASKKADHFHEACILGNVWLDHRGFSSLSSQGGFGIGEWAVLCALLLESGGYQGRALFSPRYSAIQLFKAMLQVLSSRDLTQPYVVRGECTIAASSQPIFYDVQTGVNVFYKTTPYAYYHLKDMASSSLALLNSKNGTAFQSTFLTRISMPQLQADETFEISLEGSDNARPSMLTEIYETLKEGFQDRVSLIHLRHAPSATWKVTSSVPATRITNFSLSLQINADTSSRLIDHGPSIEEKEALAHFRRFWGDKAELRKFKDGRINETLVWSADTSPTHQIVTFLLARHFKIPPPSISSSPSIMKHLNDPVSAVEAFALVNQRFQTLASTLHHLDGLPLPIRSVSPNSEHLRSAALLLPLAGPAQPIDITIQFDTSGRWPDDLRAIQYTKIAFLTKLSDLLPSSRVGLEPESDSEISNTAFLDITSTTPATPLIFRLRIHHDRELHLLQTALAGSLTPAARDAHQLALHTYKRTVARIAHTNAMRALPFPHLSGTIRLVKLFVHAHNLSNHIPPEALELLAAKVFVDPAPFHAPASAETAFLRVLSLLAQWDWAATPLLVTLSDSLNAEEAHSRFNAWRKMDPTCNTVAWFVAGTDSTGTAFTQGVVGDPAPQRVVAGRLRALAAAAVDSVTRVADWSAVFTASMADYDFVLHVKRRRASKFKNLDLGVDADVSGVDDQRALVEDLQRCFGSAAVFFSGAGGIGGLWRPGVQDEKMWKIRLGYSTVPGKEGCRANVDGMLAEIGMLGEGIIEKITVKE